MNKREFLRRSAGVGLGALLGEKVWARYADLPAERLADDEAFWTAIRSKYRLKPDYINLESGYYSIQATPVLEAFIEKVREINYQGSYYLRTTQVPDKARVRDRLAAIAGCASSELCITRNTTESIGAVVSGKDWKAGDEAVMAEQDYGHMIAQFKLMARRYGIVNKIVNVPADPRTDDEIVQRYADAITPRTRLLMVSHIINVTGQILPVRRIADMAHGRGVEVLVDGAHAFAHFDYKIPDLGCDYYAASLHKWLGCPLGTGILYVKREKIPALWPIFADWRYPAQGSAAALPPAILDDSRACAAQRDHEHARGPGAHLRDRERRHSRRDTGRPREDPTGQVQDLDERRRQRGRRRARRPRDAAPVHPAPGARYARESDH
jgi:hypothetical protein